MYIFIFMLLHKPEMSHSEAGFLFSIHTRCLLVVMLPQRIQPAGLYYEHAHAMGWIGDIYGSQRRLHISHSPILDRYLHNQMNVQTCRLYSKVKGITDSLSNVWLAGICISRNKDASNMYPTKCPRGLGGADLPTASLLFTETSFSRSEDIDYRRRDWKMFLLPPLAVKGKSPNSECLYNSMHYLSPQLHIVAAIL